MENLLDNNFVQQNTKQEGSRHKDTISVLVCSSSDANEKHDEAVEQLRNLESIIQEDLTEFCVTVHHQCLENPSILYCANFVILLPTRQKMLSIEQWLITLCETSKYVLYY